MEGFMGKWVYESTFLGTYFLTGVPQIGCAQGMPSSDRRDKRPRSSLRLGGQQAHRLIAPDFRQQVMIFLTGKLMGTSSRIVLRPRAASARGLTVWLDRSLHGGAAGRVLGGTNAVLLTPHNYGGMPDIKTKTINTKSRLYRIT